MVLFAKSATATKVLRIGAMMGPVVSLMQRRRGFFVMARVMCVVLLHPIVLVVAFGVCSMQFDGIVVGSDGGIWVGTIYTVHSNSLCRNITS